MTLSTKISSHKFSRPWAVNAHQWCVLWLCMLKRTTPLALLVSLQGKRCTRHKASHCRDCNIQTHHLSSTFLLSLTTLLWANSAKRPHTSGAFLPIQAQAPAWKLSRCSHSAICHSAQAPSLPCLTIKPDCQMRCTTRLRCCDRGCMDHGHLHHPVDTSPCKLPIRFSGGYLLPQTCVEKLWLVPCVHYLQVQLYLRAKRKIIVQGDLLPLNNCSFKGLDWVDAYCAAQQIINFRVDWGANFSPGEGGGGPHESAWLLAWVSQCFWQCLYSMGHPLIRLVCVLWLYTARKVMECLHFYQLLPWTDACRSPWRPS